MSPDVVSGVIVGSFLWSQPMPLSKLQKNPETSEFTLHERQRRELMQAIAHCGARPVADLTEMSDAERCKWLFWNLHENLENIRAMEPTLQARVTAGVAMARGSWATAPT